VIFISEPSEQAMAAIGNRVIVINYLGGRLSIRYKGVELAYRTFDKIGQVDQGAIADNKRLRQILPMIRDEQLRRGPHRHSGSRQRDQQSPERKRLACGSAGALCAPWKRSLPIIARTCGSLSFHTQRS
jgi:hypothetical protein